VGKQVEATHGRFQCGDVKPLLSKKKTGQAEARADLQYTQLRLQAGYNQGYRDPGFIGISVQFAANLIGTQRMFSCKLRCQCIKGQCSKESVKFR